MLIESTALSVVTVLTPARFGDDRGWFSETWNADRMRGAGIDVPFVQDNHSFSATSGTLRGLHYQRPPRAQDKLVRCSRGAILDVAVDVRKGSPTFGQWVAVELSATNGRQLFVPKGFLHGFVTLTDETEVQYKCSDTRAGVRWRGAVGQCRHRLGHGCAHPVGQGCRRHPLRRFRQPLHLRGCGMKILITGGAGFIGSAVVRLAVARGHEVVNLDALTYAANLANVAGVAQSNLYSFEQADIRDRAALERIFATHRPDAVMHLAAESHVDRSIDGPADFVETNITGTFNLLEAARGHWMRAGKPDTFRFHHISTDEVFGSLGPTGQFTEHTPYDPRSPYSASKAASDHLVRAWHETYGLPVVLTNCSNNYGPYHFPEKLIPVVILNALHGRAIPVYGDGRNVRDWLYVEDHADALLLVLEKGALGRSYNIGGENERTNIDLVRTICRILDGKRPLPNGSYADLITFVTDRPGHDARYAIDPSRIREELGWRPSVTVEEGLARTVQWYLDNEDWWRPLLDRQGVGQRLGVAPMTASGVTATGVAVGA